MNITMGRREFVRRSAAVAACLAAGLRPAWAGGDPTKLDNPFFPYSFEFNKEHPLENPEKALKELGYDGVGLCGLQSFAETLASYRGEGLKVFATYLINGVDLPGPGFKNVVNTGKTLLARWWEAALFSPNAPALCLYLARSEAPPR